MTLVIWLAMFCVVLIARTWLIRSHERHQARMLKMERLYSEWALADAMYFECMRKMLDAKRRGDVEATNELMRQGLDLWVKAQQAERAAKRGVR